MFLALQEIFIDKIENLIKDNQPHKSIVFIVCKVGCGFLQFYCSFEFPLTF